MRKTYGKRGLLFGVLVFFMISSFIPVITNNISSASRPFSNIDVELWVKDGSNWVKNIEACPGTVLEFKIEVSDCSGFPFILTAILPPDLEYVSGTGDPEVDPNDEGGTNIVWTYDTCGSAPDTFYFSALMTEQYENNEVLAIGLVLFPNKSDSDTVQVDKTPQPDLVCQGSLGWTEVNPDSTVTGSFTVGNVGDDGSNLNWEIKSYPNWGSDWSFAPSSGTGLKPEDGWVTVQVSVKAPDEYGTTFTGKIEVVNTDDNSDSCEVDVSLQTKENNPPTVQINYPSEGDNVAGTITIQGTAADSDGIVTQVQVKIDSGSWWTASGTTSWSTNWDTTTVSDGPHTIYARSKDDDGAYSTSDSVTVTVNISNSPPTVSITSPTGGTVSGTSVSIQGTAADSDGIVTQVQVKIDSGSWWTASGTTSWSTNWDTTTVSDGPHTIYAQSKDDKDAYSTQASVTVTVNNGGTNNPPNQPTKPTGQTVSCKVNTPYPYSTSATDSDPGDKLKYGWDWTGDGVVDKWDDNNGNYYTPGTPITTQITWTAKQTTYSLRVIDEDLNGAQSPWSLPLSVTTPRNKPYINTPFLNFLENHPHLFPLLRQLLNMQ